jgi:hypothetical protein
VLVESGNNRSACAVFMAVLVLSSAMLVLNDTAALVLEQLPSCQHEHRHAERTMSASAGLVLL